MLLELWGDDDQQQMLRLQHVMRLELWPPSWCALHGVPVERGMPGHHVAALATAPGLVAGEDGEGEWEGAVQKQKRMIGADAGEAVQRQKMTDAAVWGTAA